ncbi:hypothetical protein [Campylobacter ureolyticus]|uniref:hypothetical protein n=1 Tax=Campylobacter ureolyticus TaxID=827 RepID=UPI0022B2E6A6|nr:hypothetical protein [Campylobacter ureolyticus]MCZ6157805.1 hypothetical protein [Campylobacter ureolyticus]MCZ6174779.1 hypothetical protein [Campylobacter ureolyticus]
MIEFKNSNFTKRSFSMKKVKNFLATRKGKFLGVFTLGSLMATNAMAEGITFTKDTGFSGSFDLTYYYSAIGIVVTAIAVVAAIGLGIRQFRKI